MLNDGINTTKEHRKIPIGNRTVSQLASTSINRKQKHNHHGAPGHMHFPTGNSRLLGTAAKRLPSPDLELTVLAKAWTFDHHNF